MDIHQTFHCIATATFGLEALVKKELTRLGFEVFGAQDGGVHFNADLSGIARANLWLRCADRVLIELGRFPAATYEELYQGVKALPWGDLIPRDGRFPVTKAKSVKAALFSVPDIQSVSKKAVVDSLLAAHRCGSLPENGSGLYSIMVSNHKNEVSVTVDTTGESLHKRGYRTAQNSAPIKETLAAALIMLSKWHPNHTLYDPFCGSGTIPIEAAMIALRMAPGLNRMFAFESWGEDASYVLKKERREAMALMDLERPVHIEGSDIDYFSVKIAQENAANLGLEDVIRFQKLDFKDFSSHKKYAYVITNPPYGERMGEKEDCEYLYKLMGEKFRKNDTWSVHVICAHEGFEKIYGRAEKNRKLYNGKLKSYFYQYPGPLPPNLAAKAKKND